MRTKSDRETGRIASVATILAGLIAAPAAAQVTSQVSLDVHGAQTNKDSFGGTLSVDGRYVGFFCYDNLMDLGEGLLGQPSHVYLRDRFTGTLERISVSS